MVYSIAGKHMSCCRRSLLVAICKLQWCLLKFKHHLAKILQHMHTVLISHVSSLVSLCDFFFIYVPLFGDLGLASVVKETLSGQKKNSQVTFKKKWKSWNTSKKKVGFQMCAQLCVGFHSTQPDQLQFEGDQICTYIHILFLYKTNMQCNSCLDWVRIMSFEHVVWWFGCVISKSSCGSNVYQTYI